MTDMSDYMEDQLVLAIFRTGSLTAITTLALALLTTDPDDDDTGVFGSETGVEVPNTNGYDRVGENVPVGTTIDPDNGNWTATAGGDGQTDNATALTFPAASGGNWGTVTAVAILTSQTYNTAEMLFWSGLTIDQPINDGATAEFAIGALTVTFD